MTGQGSPRRDSQSPQKHPSNPGPPGLTGLNGFKIKVKASGPGALNRIAGLEERRWREKESSRRARPDLASNNEGFWIWGLGFRGFRVTGLGV